MKQFTICCMLATAALVLQWGADASANEYQPDHVIIRFSTVTSPEEADSLLEDPRVTGEAMLADSMTILVRIPPQLTVPQAILQFSELPIVEYAGPNYFCYIVENQQLSQAFLDANSEPYVDGFTPDEFFGQYAVAATRMDEAHVTLDGAGTLIASIDNGIDFSHPIFAGRIAPDGYDFLDDDPDPLFEAGTYSGHGTFCAGLLLLAAPAATVVPLRALNGDGYGTTFSVVMAVDHAISLGVDVIAMGFGMKFDDPVLRSAMDRAELASILCVAPAGNDGSSDAQYPAAHAAVVAVAAIDSSDRKTDFSNFGTWVDVCAPGLAVYSALPGGDVWGRWEGTSFAAPLGAGLCALLRQAHPGLPAHSVRDLIRHGADDIDGANPEFVGQLGAGRINFVQSLGEPGILRVIYGAVTSDLGTGIPGTVLTLRTEGAAGTVAEETSDELGRFTLPVQGGAYSLSVSSPDACAWQSLPDTSIQLEEDLGLALALAAAGEDPCGIAGDFDRDGVVDIRDVVCAIEAAFRGGAVPGPLAGCQYLSGDTDCNGYHDVTDVTRVINVAFRGVAADLEFCLFCP